MRRLWMAVLIVPVLALAVPTGASATSSAPAARTQRAAAATGQVLREGMHGLSTRELQRKLTALHYYPGPVDGQFGIDTLEAVWAFQETQGLPGEDYVSSAMERALNNPRAPQVLDAAAGPNRIEVNLSTEVLVLYHNNQIELISHVSSGGHYYYCSPGGGCGYAVTPTGNFRTVVFMPGWVIVPLGEMYNPVFFIGTAYAIHGDTDVPLQPVSHGCVRIPMDIAAFFHTLVTVPGEPVIVRG
ncbi:MAG TPA: L,D-transpeptidase family protein [Streptosporangiaceae bacterium]|nr:L,D-transpeptidase family protein [Streptosporangiaceae bacterium]